MTDIWDYSDDLIIIRKHLVGQESNYQLAQMYSFGHGVERDKKGESHHLKEAAIGGHTFAMYNLACDVEMVESKKQ